MEINSFESTKDYLDSVNRIFQRTQAPEMKIAMKYCDMALEKQIPKSPDTKNNEYGSWNCPSCGLAYGYPANHCYCPNCGQAIKWK